MMYPGINPVTQFRMLRVHTRGLEAETLRKTNTRQTEQDGGFWSFLRQQHQALFGEAC